MHYRSIHHFNPYCSNMLLCSRCGFLAETSIGASFLFFFCVLKIKHLEKN